MAFRGIARILPRQTSAKLFTPTCFRGFAEEKSSEATGKAAENEDQRLKEIDARLKTVESEALHYKDLYVRAVAEQENIRKRLTREIENEGNYSITKFAKEMLEVNDNLERALSNTSKSENPEKTLKELLEGVSMTRDILKGVFTKFHISEYSPCNEKFDPNFHEALMAYEDKSKEPGSVGQVFVNGFKIKDRVLRCAKVGVVKK